MRKTLRTWGRVSEHVITSRIIYNELLERFCNLQRFRWSILDDVGNYEQDILNGIFDIHGRCQDPNEVVFAPTGYFQVKTSEDVRSLLRTYLAYNTILFVGCGSGLKDTSFNVLLTWMSSGAQIITNHH